MKKNNEIFECYSPRLQGWFQSKGIRYERTFVHSKTNRKCWTYIMDDKLSIALKLWSNSNPNKNSEKVI